jgi:hypothetical protein
MSWEAQKQPNDETLYLTPAEWLDGDEVTDPALTDDDLSDLAQRLMPTLEKDNIVLRGGDDALYDALEFQRAEARYAAVNARDLEARWYSSRA